ncbi:MAG: hypothetical protein JWN02_543 [Acidobacteria bacterium]|nr:hypothetical protein [Acidobacteriota bacterium]
MWKRIWKRLVPRFLVSLLLLPSLAHAGTIGGVAVSPPFFTPSLAQSESIRFRLGAAGVVSVSIVDRDGFVVRKLDSRRRERGEVTLQWDGRDDDGVVVPDEAYTLRIEQVAGGQRSVYDPGRDHHPILEDPAQRSYSREDGVLSYRLARPSRVHIEAGQARLNPKSGRNEGPILKTVVDRQPRVAGAVIEKWNGYDDGGTIAVTALPHFAVSILAASLPENAIITCGNRGESFLAYAARHRPASAMAPREMPAMASHLHHMGLNAFEDKTPSLRVEPDAAYDREARLFRSAVKPLRIRLTVDPQVARHFLAQPTRVSVYVDEQRVITRQRPADGAEVTIAADQLPPGEHRVVVNWGSDFGPVAVRAFRLAVGNVAATRMAKGGR